jgi:cyclic dehypoxanthinyl futalosine synthase
MPESKLIEKINVGIRLDARDALILLQEMPLGELMRCAHTRRLQHHPDNKVTFVFDTNPNYTNVCETICTFCAFWRSEKSREAYTLSPEELAERVDKAWHAGATTVLFQGGHNPNVSLQDFIDYIRAIQIKTPDIHIHPFSPSEIIYMADIENLSTVDVLQTIWNEGIYTIPGGGAEILSERVRKLISPKKNSSYRWLSVMEEAHRIGFKTTATMMYGHEETDEEIIEHFLRLRELQDRTSGFSSFIPWSFKPENSTLGKKIKQSASPIKYLRIISTARLLLDNFSNIQSSWFSEDKKTGQLGLLAGANDFGGLLFEENVLKKARHTPKTNLEETLDTIRQMGFIPAQRNTRYQIIREY